MWVDLKSKLLKLWAEIGFSGLVAWAVHDFPFCAVGRLKSVNIIKRDRTPSFPAPLPPHPFSYFPHLSPLLLLLLLPFLFFLLLLQNDLCGPSPPLSFKNRERYELYICMVVVALLKTIYVIQRFFCFFLSTTLLLLLVLPPFHPSLHLAEASTMAK